MAKKKDEQNARVRVIEASQLEGIDWSKVDDYDWFDAPMEVRKQAVPLFLDWAWEHYRRMMWDEYKKSISQNHYAKKTIGINEQLFSLYKSGRRFPNPVNADILAAYFGPVIWDMCGYARRMPKNKALYEFADSWPKLKENDRAELLERLRNKLDNYNPSEIDEEAIPRDVYYG